MSVETELAWAAGFFDGEGNVGCVKHESRKQATYLRIHAQIAQVDRRVLDRFHRAVGVGHVRGPYQPSGNRRPVFCWSTQSKFGVETVALLLSPYLGEIKQEQFRQSLEAMAQYRSGA